MVTNYILIKIHGGEIWINKLNKISKKKMKRLKYYERATLSVIASLWKLHHPITTDCCKVKKKDQEVGQHHMPSAR
jgi:hypothetical protein